MPRLTVCIPTYNGANYLKEAIASVLRQTFADFELIIVDDGSTDESEAIIESFHDNRLRFFKNPVRLELVGNWNRCIQLSTGKYICIFHQDDVMEETNLAEKVEIMENSPTVGFIYSDVFLIDSGGKTTATGWPQKTEPYQNFILPGADYFQTLIAGPNLICCPSVLARRECYEELGDFDTRLSFTADWEMWLKLSLFYDVAYLAKPLLRYRWHPGSETQKYSEAAGLKEKHQAKITILEKYPERITNASALKLEITLNYQQQAFESAIGYLAKGDVVKAEDYFSLVNEFKTCLANQNYPLISHQFIREQLIYRNHIITKLSPQVIAQQIPIKKIIEAIWYKILAFRWLRRWWGSE